MGNEASLKAAKAYANMYQGSDNPHVAAQAKSALSYAEHFHLPKADYMKACLKSLHLPAQDNLTLGDVQDIHGYGASMKARMWLWHHFPSLFPPQL